MKKARLGVAPIAWSNDDLPELGGDTPLDTCLSEMAQAGYSGTETGGKYPLSAQELGPILEGHGLALVSGWYSGELLVNSVEEEKRRAKAQVDLFRELGAFAFVYGETSNTIQGRRDVPLAARPSLTDAEMRDYGRRMDEFAAWVNETCGAPFAYHHHMGAVVQFEDDVDRFLACTADETGLLFDTGHLQFSGGDPIGAIARWGSRLRPLHRHDLPAHPAPTGSRGGTRGGRSPAGARASVTSTARTCGPTCSRASTGSGTRSWTPSSPACSPSPATG